MTLPCQTRYVRRVKRSDTRLVDIAKARRYLRLYDADAVLSRGVQKCTILAPCGDHRHKLELLYNPRYIALPRADHNACRSAPSCIARRLFDFARPHRYNTQRGQAAAYLLGKNSSKLKCYAQTIATSYKRSAEQSSKEAFNVIILFCSI